MRKSNQSNQKKPQINRMRDHQPVESPQIDGSKIPHYQSWDACTHDHNGRRIVIHFRDFPVNYTNLAPANT